MARRLVAIGLGVVILVLVLAGGAAAWVVWIPDTLKLPVQRILTAQLGRKVRIDGELRVEPGRVTTIEVNDLHVAAPEWARADDLLAIARLRIGADLWAYFRERTIRIAEFTAKGPQVALERDAQGRTSWPAGADGTGGGMPKLELGRIEIDDGRLTYSDAAGAVDLAAALATKSSDNGGIGLQADGRGTVGADPLQFDVKVGALRQLAQGSAPVPVEGTLALAGTRVELTGEIRQPASMAGISLNLQLRSDDPGRLLALAGRPPTTPAPPLAVSLKLTGGGKSYTLDELRAQWGESDLAGRLQVDLDGDRSRLDGVVKAKLLDVAGLVPMLSQPTETQTPIGNPLRPLASYQGQISLAADEIRLPSQVVLHDTAVRLELSDGRLKAAPLRLGLPEGTVEGELATGPLDAEELTVETSIRAARVGLAALGGKGYRGRIDGKLGGTLLVGSLLDTLRRSRLRFEGSGTELAVPQAELGAFTMTAMLADGQLRLEPLQATLPQGEVAGRVTAGPFDDSFSADIDVDAKGVDLAAIARSDGFAGRLDGKLSGTLRGTVPLDILTRSKIRLTGKVTGLRLPEVERRIGDAEIDASLDPDRRESLKLVAHARAGDRPLELTAFGGSFGTLAGNDGEYPFTIVSELGKNEIKVNGTVTLPLTDRRFSSTIAAQGPDPSPILALLELPKLQFPPYRLKGVLTNRGDELQIKGFDGRIGDSDIAADLTIDSAGERPRIAGTVRSHVLDGDDLGGLVGVTPAIGPGETASPGQKSEAQQIEGRTDVLPNEPIDPARWRHVDFDLAVHADKIHAGKVPLDGFSGQVTVDDGLLRIQNMDLIVGEGHLTGSIEADGRRSPVQGKLDIDLQRASVASLLRRIDVDATALGTLSGQARGGVGLGGQGRSIKEILAHSNGEVRLQMEGGQIDRTIVAGLGLDLLRLLGAATGASPETVTMRCALVDLGIRDGVVSTDPLLIDTEIADLGGRGTIDLGNETIDLSLTARPKNTPLLTDLTGISVGGRLGKPEISINPVAIAARGVAAATLGIVLKPFTSLAGAATDDSTPSPCADLLKQAAAAPPNG